MTRRAILAASTAIAAICCAPPIEGIAADDRPAEDGWRMLFDGSSTEGWRDGRDGPYDDGAVQIHGVGGPYLYHEDVFADFVLRCEVKQGVATAWFRNVRIGDLGVDPK